MSLLRLIFRFFTTKYPIEYGRYSLLTKIYQPFLAPTTDIFQEVKLPFGFTMRLNLREYIQSMLFLFNSYEDSTLKFLKSVLRKDSTIVDVGANVGFISLYCASLCPNGRVFSFEPEPANFRILLDNIRLNSWEHLIVPNNYALSDSTGKLKLFQSNKENNDGVHSLVQNENVDHTKWVEVDVKRFDSIVTEQGIKKIDLIKIDVEGAEIDVLHGMEESIISNQPLIVMEISAAQQNSRGYSVKGFKEYMKTTFNYDSWVILESGQLRKSSLEEFHLMENVVFAPSKTNFA